MMCQRPDGGIGRRRTLKMFSRETGVWVRVPLGALLNYVGVAQLVVHGTPNPEVEGSIPSTHAKSRT